MAILVWTLSGLLVAYLALRTLEGSREFGIAIALGLGAGGGVFGGYLAVVAQLSPSELSITSTLLALLCALVVMYTYHKMA